MLECTGQVVRQEGRDESGKSEEKLHLMRLEDKELKQKSLSCVQAGNTREERGNQLSLMYAILLLVGSSEKRNFLTYCPFTSSIEWEKARCN